MAEEWNNAPSFVARHRSIVGTIKVHARLKSLPPRVAKHNNTQQVSLLSQALNARTIPNVRSIDSILRRKMAFTRSISSLDGFGDTPLSSACTASHRSWSISSMDLCTEPNFAEKERSVIDTCAREIPLRLSACLDYACTDPAMAHTCAMEESGQSFADFLDACRRDSAAQIGSLRAVASKITSAVSYCHSNPPLVSNGVSSSFLQQVEALGVFEGAQPLCCSVDRYITRMVKYSGCSVCNVYIGLVYLQRIQRSTCPMLGLSPTNIQRLLLTAIMVASKVSTYAYAT